MMRLMSGRTGDIDVITEITKKPVEKIKMKVKRPSFFVVVVHNDPFTPRFFVVEVLKRFFNKAEPEANRIMLLAHNYGVGVVAKYSREIAESKAKQVNEYAKLAGFPLHFSSEDE
jgi:ATP-dependent Clp protease adaptor protein ClpS